MGLAASARKEAVKAAGPEPDAQEHCISESLQYVVTLLPSPSHRWDLGRQAPRRHALPPVGL